VVGEILGISLLEEEEGTPHDPVVKF